MMQVSFYSWFFNYLFILFLAGLGFRCCVLLQFLWGGRLPRCGTWTFHCDGFFCYRTRAVEQGLNSCGAWVWLSHWHVESSQTRDRTHVPCISWWIPIYCSTGETQCWLSLSRESMDNFVFFFQFFLHL